MVSVRDLEVKRRSISGVVSREFSVVADLCTCYKVIGEGPTLYDQRD
jgi:hypothetical protein